MRVRLFGALVAAGPGGRAAIVVPCDPDEVWGAKAEHPVGGTMDGSRFRRTISPGGGGWVVTSAREAWSRPVRGPEAVMRSIWLNGSRLGLGGRRCG